MQLVYPNAVQRPSLFSVKLLSCCPCSLPSNTLLSNDALNRFFRHSFPAILEHAHRGRVRKSSE